MSGARGSTRKTKAQQAEERRKDVQRAIRARDCDGCPYRGCIGATATLSWDQMTARARGEE